MLLDPITRVEHYLYEIITGASPARDPITREEHYLSAILGVGDAPTPITRIEKYLAKIAGEDVDTPMPVTRIEYFLAKKAGLDVEVPTPITRLEHYLAEWIEAAPSSYDVTVTGTLPLTLAHSLAANIIALVRYGAMTQTTSPTPSAPVYPTINNGTVAMVHRSGLPSGYKLLEYVGSSGSAYVVTDVYLASTDVVEAEFRNNSTTGFGSLYGVFRLGDSSALYANQTYYGYDESNNKVDTNLRVDTAWHTSRHDFVNGTLTIDDTTVTFPPFEFANSIRNAVLARYYNNSYGYIWKGFIRKFKVTRGGEVICDLLPAKNESDEAGLYDLISGNFYRATSGTLVAGDEVNDYEPAVVGTPEVLTVGGANLLNPATVPDEFAYVNKSTGRTISNENFRYSDFIPIKGGVAYYFGILPFSASTAGLAWYSEADEETYISGISGTVLDTHGMVETAPEDARYVRFSIRVADDPDWETTNYFCVNGTLDAYQPYTAPQTATVPDLYAVGDYADSVDVVSGTVTRNVGIRVFDGTEEWAAHSVAGTYRCRIEDKKVEKSPFTSTHFVYSSKASSDISNGEMMCGAASTNAYFRNTDCATLADFTAWLAAQYAAGTPVIIWYPLETPTTESIAPQALRSVNGTTVISSSAGSVGATVEYRASEQPVGLFAAPPTPQGSDEVVDDPAPQEESAVFSSPENAPVDGNEETEDNEKGDEE